MKPPYTAPEYRGRDQMTLEEFITDVEACHFRTAHDTGANRNALMVWNILRNYAGLDCLETDDLHKNHARVDGLDWEQVKADSEAFDAWQKEQRK